MTVDRYDEFAVGDDVWCLAWIGMPFAVVGKDDETRIIKIDGTAPCSLPEGARLDLLPQNHYLLSHEQWDQIWYWPDIAGEHYLEVVDRFIETHHEGEVVNGYAAGSVTVEPRPKSAMTFRMSFVDYQPFGQIKAHPVAAVAADGTLLVEFDPTIADQLWLPTGPAVALDIRMLGYRWALTYGRMVLNSTDFGT